MTVIKVSKSKQPVSETQVEDDDMESVVSTEMSVLYLFVAGSLNFPVMTGIFRDTFLDLKIDVFFFISIAPLSKDDSYVSV